VTPVEHCSESPAEIREAEWLLLTAGQLSSMSGSEAEELRGKHPRLPHLQAKYAAFSTDLKPKDMNALFFPFQLQSANLMQLAASKLSALQSNV